MVRVNRFVQSDRVADRLTATLIKEELLPAYRQSLDSIRAEVGLLYEKHAKDGVLSMSDVTQYNRLKNTEKRIAAEMGRLQDKQVRTTSKTIKGVYEESFYRTAYAIEFEAQAKLRFGELPSKQVDAAIVNPMDRIGWKDRTLEGARLATRQVREEIAQGIIQGKGYPEVAREVKDRMGMAAYRAERIVRTEAHRAREMGKLASLEHAAKEGVEMEKVWDAAMDQRTRDSHQGLDGQVVPVFDEDGNPGIFISPVTGATAEYPGGFGVAEEDINCRCAAAGQIMGYGPEVRRARLTEEEYQEAKDEEAALAQQEGRPPRPIPRGKVVPYQTYPQYADAKGWPRRYKGPEPRAVGPIEKE